MRTVDPQKLPRILQAAALLFAERPFTEVRMADVAAKAKVAKGTLYLHFTNKESLFRAMVAEVSGRLLDEVQGQLTRLKNIHERLRALVRVSVSFSAQYPHYLETLHRLDGSPPREEDVEIRQRRERLSGLIEKLLRAAHLSGELSVPHPARSTLALLGMLHRVMQDTPQPWPADLADWITDQFFFGMSKGNHLPGI